MLTSIFALGLLAVTGDVANITSARRVVADSLGYPERIFFDRSASASATTSVDPEQQLLSFVRENFASLGLRSPDDLLDVRLENLKVIPGADGLDDSVETVADWVQSFKGYELRKGKVSLVAIDGALVAVHGKLHSRSEIERVFSGRGPRITEKEAAARVPKRSTDEVVVSLPLVDVKLGAVIYRVDSGQGVTVIDAETGAVLDSWLDNEAYSPFAAAHMVGYPHQPVWFPNGAPGYTETFYGTPVDREIAGSTCNFRMTWNGNPPQAPFPRTRLGGEAQRIYQGDCGTATPAFSNTAEGVSLWLQHAHNRIASAAYQTANNANLGLWAVRGPDEAASLTVEVHTTSDYCGTGSGGSYNNGANRICLSVTQWQRYRAPNHEFGHYLADMYGMDDNSANCEKVTQEGVADAVAVIMEWYRRSGTYSYGLFVWGPGPGMDRVRGGTTYNPGPANGLAPASTSCGSGDLYGQGMAISQVVWSFLNNSWCMDGQPFCSDQRLSDSLSNDQVATIGRHAFGYALDEIGNANVNPHVFLVLMNEYIMDHYYYSFSSDERNRINSTFNQH